MSHNKPDLEQHQSVAGPLYFPYGMVTWTSKYFTKHLLNIYFKIGVYVYISMQNLWYINCPSGNETEIFCDHYSDVIMSVTASPISSVSIVCSTVCSGANQRNHQSSASLAFERGIHRWPENYPHIGHVAIVYSFDNVIMISVRRQLIVALHRRPSRYLKQ